MRVSSSRKFRVLKRPRDVSRPTRESNAWVSVRRRVYVRRVNSNDNKNVKFYIRKTNRPMTFSLTLPLFFLFLSSFPPFSLLRIYFKLEFFHVRDNKERTVLERREAASETNEHDFSYKSLSTILLFECHWNVHIWSRTVVVFAVSCLTSSQRFTSIRCSKFEPDNYIVYFCRL